MAVTKYLLKKGVLLGGQLSLVSVVVMVVVISGVGVIVYLGCRGCRYVRLRVVP